MPNPVIQVRVSEETLVEIDKRGNRSDVIRAALEAYLHPKPADKLIGFRVLPSQGQFVPYAPSAYSRPSHDPTCKCLMCKPPKP